MDIPVAAALAIPRCSDLPPWYPLCKCASVGCVQALLLGGDRQVRQSVPQANALLFSRLILPPWHCGVATTLRKER